MFDELLAALKAIGIPFEAYAWSVAPDDTYGVLALTGGADALGGDNRITEQSVEGTVDLYTRSKSTADAIRVQDALNSFDGCSWSLNSVQYEDETSFVHFEWIINLERL